MEGVYMKYCLYLLIMTAFLSGCTDTPGDPDDYIAHLTIQRDSGVYCTVNGEDVVWEEYGERFTYAIVDDFSIDVVVHAVPESSGEVYYRLHNYFSWETIGPAAMFPDGYRIDLYKAVMLFDVVLISK
jgi:hypothetical protein